MENEEINVDLVEQTEPPTPKKFWLKSKLVWGVILGVISYWADATGYSLDQVAAHMNEVWNSISAILVALGLRTAKTELTWKK